MTDVWLCPFRRFRVGGVRLRTQPGVGSRARNAAGLDKVKRNAARGLLSGLTLTSPSSRMGQMGARARMRPVLRPRREPRRRRVQRDITGRSLACTNIIENVMGTVRRVCRNVKYWRSRSMALRWAAAAMQEAIKGFRRLKGYKHLPALRAACKARPTAAFRRGACSNRRGCVNVNAQRPLREFQQTAGHPLFLGYPPLQMNRFWVRRHVAI